MKILKKYKIIFAIIIVIILLIGVFNIFNSTSSTIVDLTSADSFFLQTDGSKYVLYNLDGKKINNGVFNYASDFYNRVAKVKDESNNYGIINDKGKMIIPFSKYKDITAYGSLFKVNNGKKDLIINAKGKIVYKAKKLNVSVYLNNYSFIVIDDENNYIVMNYNGKKILKLKKNKKYSLEFKNSEYYGTLYYNNKNYIFDVNEGKIIKTIKYKNSYCINDYNENKILLNDCNKNNSYKVIDKNKIHNISSKCNSVYFEDANLICDTYLLNDKYKPINYSINDMSYIDYNNYLLKEDSKLKFVKNGKIVKELENYSISDKSNISNGYYLTYYNGSYIYFNSKGKDIFKKEFKNAVLFDENGLAKVSEDGNSFYYINKKGKKVSDNFKYSSNNGLYYVIDNESKKEVINNKGKVLLSGEYDKLEIRKSNNNYYIYAVSNNEYKLMSVNSKKTLIKSETELSFYNNYVKLSTGEVYSYNGKLLK